MDCSDERTRTATAAETTTAMTTIQDLLEVNNAAVDELVHRRLHRYSRRPAYQDVLSSSPPSSPPPPSMSSSTSEQADDDNDDGDDDAGLLKPLQLFTSCLQSIQTYLRRIEQHEERIRNHSRDAKLEPAGQCAGDAGSVGGPSIEISSLDSLFNYSLCGIDSRYFVYTNSIKLRLDDGDEECDDDYYYYYDDADDDQTDVDDQGCRHRRRCRRRDQIDVISYAEVVTGVLLFNIAQVYHIVGLQQKERRQRRHQEHHQQAATSDCSTQQPPSQCQEDDAIGNLLKAERMYLLAIQIMNRRVQDIVSAPPSLIQQQQSSSATTTSMTNNSVYVPILVTLGAMNNLATLQLRRRDHSRTTCQHLLGLLSSLTQSSGGGNSCPPSRLSGVLQGHEWNGMISNCVLVLLHDPSRTSSSLSDSSAPSDDDDCNAAPAA